MIVGLITLLIANALRKERDETKMKMREIKFWREVLKETIQFIDKMIEKYG